MLPHSIETIKPQGSVCPRFYTLVMSHYVRACVLSVLLSKREVELRVERYGGAGSSRDGVCPRSGSTPSSSPSCSRFLQVLRDFFLSWGSSFYFFVVAPLGGSRRCMPAEASAGLLRSAPLEFTGSMALPSRCSCSWFGSIV